jgi:hypothetical protein
MKILQNIFDEALNSSKTTLALAKHVATLASELKSVKESLALLIKTVNVQQIVIEQLLQERTTISSSNRTETAHDGQKNHKKEKPN